MATPATDTSKTTDSRPGNAGGTGTASPVRRAGSPTSHASLATEHGQTRIADGVVAKIAGMAAREIPGIHSMGRGMARRVGQLRALVPGSTETDLASQGVSVEVGEREAAIDLDVVTWYGQSIVEVTDAARRNVIDRVESMTGLTVVEVNINVDDIYVEGDSDGGEPTEGRVQ